MTCSPATGRRGEQDKGKSKTDNRCRVCCGDGQYWTGAVVLRRWKGVQEVFALLECLVEYQQATGGRGVVFTDIVEIYMTGYWNGGAGNLIVMRSV